MTRKEHILQELNELKSTLAGFSSQQVYTVPDGYFQGLTEQIMRRIKALDAATATEELKQLSVLLAGLPKQMPYQVPQGYFENLAEQVMRRIKAMDAANAADELSTLSPLLAGLSKKMPFSVPSGYFENHESDDTVSIQAAEELATLSPFLSGMSKEMPYQVPQGYFDHLAESISIPTERKEKTKVVSLVSRNWFRYAAAAVVVGIITTIVFVTMGSDTPKASQSMAIFEKNLNKEIKKMSEQELNDFLQNNATGPVGTETVKVGSQDEIKDYLKDVSEAEMKTFIEETADVEDNSEPVMLN
ncbi:MAG: hypothetical protein NTW29_13705 [Bacteroidetes bacterium]|nr:hypothetical protein [Bacteroidota bacterium]